MLQKNNRLKKHSAFIATYKTGKLFHKNGVTMFLGKENSSNYPTKFGFVVSKKIHKRAVKRNRIKRLMRESMRLILKERNLNRYMSVIFVASAGLLNKNFNEIDTAIKNLVQKI